MEATMSRVVPLVILVTIVAAPGPAPAVDLLFDFEGDVAPVATDKLAEDGAQNGRMVNNVSIETESVPFGDRAARFEPPDEPEPPEPPPNQPQLFSTVEIPGTRELGSEWTLAAFVNFTNEGFTRLFSSFQGTGPPGPGRVILDFDPSGGQINFLRVIVGPDRAQAIELPEDLVAPGFKHIALTFDTGMIAVYLNGIPVPLDLDTVSTTEISAPVNMRFGEDPHDGGGTANEQFRGHVDDLLVIGRALLEEEIAEIAENGVQGKVTPSPGELAIWYDFEPPDEGTTITDRFDEDGAQNGIAHENVQIDPDVAHPLFGSQSLRLADRIPFNTIEFPETDMLGSEWSLAAFVNFTNTGFTRWFSSYQGTGAPEPNRVIFDFDPTGGAINFMRVIVGPESAQVDGVPPEFPEALTEPGYKHIALTFDSGEFAVYLDGEPVPMTTDVFTATEAFAPVNMRFGEDPHDGGGTANEQFEGHVDDLLIIGRALTPADVAAIARDGVAEANLAPVAGELAIWYDFEPPDEGQTITDRFDADGAQNAIIWKQVSVDETADEARFGTGSGLLGEGGDVEPPPPAEAPFNELEIPGTMRLGSQWTVSAFVDYTNTDFTRLFSTYQGTGGVRPNRMILDIDPSGSQIFGVRVIVGATSDPLNIAQALEIPPELNEPGFKHFALTFDEGEIHVYLNGEEIAMDSNLLSATEAFAPVNLRFGEDPHDGGGTANEQFDGNVDDLLVLGVALSAADIAAIADSGVEASGFTPEDDVLAVWYDFEPPDAGTKITDRFVADGSQNGIVHRSVRIDTEKSHPLFGTQSLLLGGAPPVDDIPFSLIDVGRLGNLGSTVTLAATFNMPDGGHSAGGLARLFSTFSGTGSTAGRLILDVNPDADIAGIGVRLILPDGTTVVHPEPFTVNENHHVAAVYDEGEVEIYFDGDLVLSSIGIGGDVDLGEFPLRIGEDLGGVINENFVGVMDDILVLSQALSAADIATLATEGAAALFDQPPIGVGPFIRGDSNVDGDLNISDPIFTLDFLFTGGPDPRCRVATDANADGDVNISDPIFALDFLFTGGPPPPAQFPDCGRSNEPRDIALGCERPSAGCE